jgi:DNA repair exonuclease SbcCD nuclease subunit
MKYPFGLVADVHCHNWSKFSTTNEHGVNTRLQSICDELVRCSQEVLRQGGDSLVIAGDLFHVRGQIKPSVINVVKGTLEFIGRLGIKTYILAGNHDAEHKDSSDLGSSIKALEGKNVITVSHSTYGMSFDGGGVLIMIPWIDDCDELLNAINGLGLSMTDRSITDLIIHAPITGVLPELSSGIHSNVLADLGFKRVFAGHYHNHKKFLGDVYSIGAIAHHTWSDIGSKAGFLIVDSDYVERHDTSLPKFVDISDTMDPDEIPLVVDGNYVRFRSKSVKGSDVERIRNELLDMNAEAVEIIALPATVEERDGTIAALSAAGASLEVSVQDYSASKGYTTEATMLAVKILSEVSE